MSEVQRKREVRIQGMRGSAGSLAAFSQWP